MLESTDNKGKENNNPISTFCRKDPLNCSTMFNSDFEEYRERKSTEREDRIKLTSGENTSQRIIYGLKTFKKKT
jgi:hypothetical protein